MKFHNVVCNWRIKFKGGNRHTAGGIGGHNVQQVLRDAHKDIVKLAEDSEHANREWESITIELKHI